MDSAEATIPKDCGSVILSFDFEIGWGDVTNNRWRMRETRGVYKRLRQVLPIILDEMERLEIPATWATVGAMFENPTERDFSHLTTDAQAVINSVLAEANPDSFNGNDLFELVLGMRTPHQIACHSYSHVPFTWNGMTNEIVGNEIVRFNAALAKYNLQTDRLVYPENREKFSDSVFASGISKVRVAAPRIHENRILHLFSSAVSIPPMAVESMEANGLTRHNGSLLFHDAGKSWRRKLLQRRIKLGIDNAIRNKKCLHVWTHPFNYAESDTLLAAFLDTLRNIAHARDAGKLKIALM